ncbi:MAG: aminotransferase class III-fold pyridoxal phosphate-dependent enzyme [Sediminibacterium sp.]|nr:aminotransferase class III-fold pyridoxal phosphate-dependent enzyme [Sediminibacterium sp.]
MKQFINTNIIKKNIHDIIPGEAHTYSIRNDQFPSNAPKAISHGKGVYVWGTNGVKYLDCSMGLTSVSLGHAYEPVFESVIEDKRKGANFQRLSYLEYEMAEIFLSIMSQHVSIKFAKNGYMITMAAIKLARNQNNH